MGSCVMLDLLLWLTDSLVVAPAPGPIGSVVAAQELSCPVACGIFVPNQESNPCPLLNHWTTREVLTPWRIFFLLLLSCQVVSDSLVSPWTVADQVPLSGIFQAIILEWVAISCSRGSFMTQGSNRTLLH